MNLTELVESFGGVAEFGVLKLHGVDQRRLARALDAGELTRVRRGCYASHSADPVKVAEVAYRGMATCITAGRQWSLPVLSSDNRVHLSVPRARTQSGRHLTMPSDVRAHYDGNHSGGHSVLRLEAALVNAARCLTPVAHLAMLDAALARGLIDPSLGARLPGMPSGRAAWLTHRMDARTQSPAESVTRAAFIAARLQFEFQVPLPGVGHVDFVVGRRLVVEVDGRPYHSDPAAFELDRRRDRAARRLGLFVARFTAAEALRDPGTLVAEVQTLLAAPLRPDRHSLAAFTSDG